MEHKHPSLISLLSMAFVAYVIELDNEFEHRMPHRTTLKPKAPPDMPKAPWLGSAAIWFSCMRYVDKEGATIAEVESRAGMSTNVDGVRRWGYVTIDSRTKKPGASSILRATQAGRRTIETWSGLFDDIDERWAERLGDDAFTALRQALTGLNERLPAGLPDYLPILGYGLAVPRPKPRSPAALEDPLLLVTLLARPILAYALEYESGFPVSLCVAANVLRLLGPEGARARDLSVRSGISKEGIEMAIGFLARQGLVEIETLGGDRIVSLTPNGQDLSHDAMARIPEVEEKWEEAFGTEMLDKVRAALTPIVGDGRPGSPLYRGLVPPPGNWRETKPTRVLPHFPAVLHRGGYPDGA